MRTSKYQNRDEFKRGVTEMLVLHMLSQGDMYGYELTHAFEDRTDGVYTMVEGTLYPILYKLEDAGLIAGYTVKVGVRRTRKVYRLEPAGHERLEELLADYMLLTPHILHMLGKDIVDREDGASQKETEQ